MKVIKTASGKKKIKISKKEWESIGKTAGWMKESEEDVVKDKRRPRSFEEIESFTFTDEDYPEWVRFDRRGHSERIDDTGRDYYYWVQKQSDGQWVIVERGGHPNSWNSLPDKARAKKMMTQHGLHHVRKL